MSNKWKNLKNGSLIQRAEEFLTELILSREFTSGEYLPPEMELCNKLGIGRSTLRETISILESKGLVRRKHGVGVMVVDGSHKAASHIIHLMFKRNQISHINILEMRRLVETQAVRWASERATEEDIKLIENAVDVMKSNSSTFDEYVDADYEFHLGITKATHNPILVIFMQTIQSILKDIIVSTLRSGLRPERSRHYHEKILEAIKERDPEKASTALSEHLLGTENLIMNNNSD